MRRPVEQQFYGDRSGQFEDPWGHRWGVSTHVEDVDDEELARRGGRDDGRARTLGPFPDQ